MPMGRGSTGFPRLLVSMSDKMNLTVVAKGQRLLFFRTLRLLRRLETLPLIADGA